MLLSAIIIFWGTLFATASEIDKNKNGSNETKSPKEEIILPSIKIEGLNESEYTPKHKNQSDTISRNIYMVADSATTHQAWASLKNAQNNRE